MSKPFTVMRATMKNIYLKRGDTLAMGKYFVTYTHHERKNKNGTPYVYYHVDFLLKDANGKMTKDFSLAPFWQINNFMGMHLSPIPNIICTRTFYTFVKFPEMSTLADTATMAKVDGELYPENLKIIQCLLATRLVWIIALPFTKDFNVGFQRSNIKRT